MKKKILVGTLFYADQRMYFVQITYNVIIGWVQIIFWQINDQWARINHNPTNQQTRYIVRTD